MAKHEYTSARIASLAAVGVKNPDKLTREELQAICGTALTQAKDKDDLEVVHAHGYDDGYQRGRRDMLEELKVLLGNM